MVKKNGYGQSGLWPLKLTVSQEGTDGINWFFACWYKFMQIKKRFKIFGVCMVKNGCGQYGDGTLKLIVAAEWTDEISWIFACWYRFTKIESLSKVFFGELRQTWVWPVCWQDSKIGYISKMSRWNKLTFLHAATNSRKLNLDSMDFWVGVVKNDHDLSVHETLKSAVS